MTYAFAPGGKLIIVDGPSANRMKDPLGIALFDFAGLYRVLVEAVGKCRRLVGPPIITMHPDHAAAGRLPKILNGAGFKVVPVGSERESDDAFIREQISAADPGQVQEIVLMSSDRDFLPELLAKRSQGVSVYYVSTMRTMNSADACSISRMLADKIRSGEIHFFELYAHRGSICESHRDPKAPAHSRDRCNGMQFSVRYPSRNVQDLLRLRNEFVRLERDFPGLKIEAMK